MSIWDWLVIIVVVAQCIAIISLIVAVLRLKNGLITRAVKRSQSFVRQGQNLATVGQRQYAVNLPHLLRIQNELAATGQTLKQSVASYEASVAELQDVLVQWGKLQSGIGIAQQGLQFLSRKKVTATGTPTKGMQKASRRSLAHRAGLVPPIVQKLERFFPAVRYGVATYRELKRRGVL